MKSFYLFIIAYLLLTGCSRNNSRQTLNEIFVKDTILSADIIHINELLVPVDAIVLDSFIVFQNDPSNGENLFFVYSYEDYQFCYSFGEIGQGPQEFVAPSFVYNSKDNNLYIYDQYGNKLTHYILYKESVCEISREESIKNDFVLQKVSFLNDSILLYSVLSNRNVNLYSFNINTNLNVDSLSFNTSLSEIQGHEYNSSYDYFNFTHEENKLIVSFEFFNEIRLVDLCENGLFTIKDKNIQGGHTINKKSLYDNMYYYAFPASTKEYVFFQYYGKMFKNLQPFPLNLSGRDFQFCVEVYDWSKRPIVRFTLDKEFLRLVTDERRKKIYTWEYQKNFDKLYSYDISWLDSM